MKILFIGGTGLISSACSELTVREGMDLTILNRGVSTKHAIPSGASLITGDVRVEENLIVEMLKNSYFDVVVDWIAFTPEDISRALRIFSRKTGQFVFISSASAYQKPPSNYLLTEQTPLENKFWQYSRDKIACEQLLIDEYRKTKFPVTIIRPSLTYGVSQIPMIMGSWNFPYTIVDRIKKRKKIIIPGDGTSLWVLTWNEDFASGLVGLFGREDAIGEAFHITSDEVLTWNQIYNELGIAIGVPMDVVHIPSDLISMYSLNSIGSLLGDKSNSVVFDNSKIKRFVPNFECKVNWAEGVRRALAWHELDPGRQLIDQEANELWDKIITRFERALPEE